MDVHELTQSLRICNIILTTISAVIYASVYIFYETRVRSFIAIQQAKIRLELGDVPDREIHIRQLSTDLVRSMEPIRPSLWIIFLLLAPITNVVIQHAFSFSARIAECVETAASLLGTVGLTFAFFYAWKLQQHVRNELIKMEEFLLDVNKDKGRNA